MRFTTSTKRSRCHLFVLGFHRYALIIVQHIYSLEQTPHKSILTSLCALYAIALASWFGLAAATGDRLWWVAFLSDLALALMLPLPVLLLLALWRRRWAALAVLVIPILLGLWLFGAQFLPGRARAPQPGEHPIGAMTLNVLYTNRDFAALASAIRTAPDTSSLRAEYE